jgi:lysine 2,3-aminomutase
MSKVRTVGELVERGLAAPEERPALEAAAEALSLSITPELLALMATGADDPIARQFVPSTAETVVDARELADAIGDATHAPLPGIVHRYPDRVLLTPVHTCPAYCRFCFRREKVGGTDRLDDAQLGAALDYIRAHREIWEVVLTGGDPLVLSDRRLRALFAALNGIEHVEVIRVHTRYPVVEPKRITDALAKLLRGRAATYVVVHCNHARELTPEAQAACGRLIDRGIPMLAQSVLLRGVNDDADTLAALMRALVRARIKPYYLHHLDLARGTGHFRTTIAEGQALMRALRGRVSGLAQPTYVLDIPGGHGKVPIGPSYIQPGAAGEYEVEDYRGGRHGYRDLAEPTGE